MAQKDITENNKQWLKRMFIVFHRKPISELRSVTCHRGSHDVTCQLTQVNAPRLNRSHAGRYSIYRPWRDGRLSWPEWLDTESVLITCPKTATHPCANRVSPGATTLMWHSVLTAVTPPPLTFALQYIAFWRWTASLWERSHCENKIVGLGVVAVAVAAYCNCECCWNIMKHYVTSCSSRSRTFAVVTRPVMLSM